MFCVFIVWTYFSNPLKKKAFNGESGYKTVPESSASLIAVRFKFSC